MTTHDCRRSDGEEVSAHSGASEIFDVALYRVLNVTKNSVLYGGLLVRAAATLACAVTLLAGYAHGREPEPSGPGVAEELAAICASSNQRAFDFWVGSWRVYVTGTDTLVGESEIRSEHRGCVITEHYRGLDGPYSGRSLNIFNQSTGLWEQFWVDSVGDITHFKGAATPTGMQLTAEDDVGPGAPDPIFSRITFSRNADGSVRQHGEASIDRGVTWRDRYDFTYRRVLGHRLTPLGG